jgi:2-polyprenyl-6-methoxyphenol hydroxylase-like FAD-dependent oxidoreductase
MILTAKAASYRTATAHSRRWRTVRTYLIIDAAAAIATFGGFGLATHDFRVYRPMWCNPTD